MIPKDRGGGEGSTPARRMAILRYDETPMPPESGPPNITPAKLALLFALFFLISSGLGYPVLNRYDPRQTAGLSDVKIYTEMVTGGGGELRVDETAVHVRFRVLVPWLAKQIYWTAKRISPVAKHFDWNAQPSSGVEQPASGTAQGRDATWDPVMFSLLVADSIFVAATAVLIVVLGARYIGNSTAGLVGALLYLMNFAVPNLRLVGLVDAGEGFFLLALLWSLAETNLWRLPLIAILGTLTKESFIPFSIAFGAVWWLAEWRDQLFSLTSRPRSIQQTQPRITRQNATKMGLFIAISWAASIAVFSILHRAIEGAFTNPLEFAFSLHRGHEFASHFAASLADHQLWYIFLWLLPTAIPKLKRFPRSWLAATSATCVVAFALDAYYGGAPGTIGRALFTVAGPILSLSSAMLLLRLFGGVSEISVGY